MGVLQTRIGANLFNVKQFAAKTKTSLNVARELMYADDCAIVAHDHATMQHLTDRFHQAVSNFGLQLNLRKTVCLYQPSPDCREHLPISVSGTDLENVSHFTYLGCIVTDDNKLEREIQNRISKGTASFGRLRQRLWNSHAVTLNVKCQIYRAVELSTLLYGAETWTIYVHHVRRLNSVMMRHLRSIMGLSLCDHIPNRVILEKAGLSDMDSTLCHKNLQCAGHVARMYNH